jgi:plasmid stabilization system protein ParE
MSRLQIPVTDAFDDANTQSVTVDLTTDQVDWLQAQADDLDLTLDQMLRSIVATQMRLEESEETESTKRKRSVVDSLRTANERLKEMMESTRSRNESTSDTLTRLRKRLGDGAPHSTDTPPSLQSSSDTPGDDAPSMFDLMD